MSENFNEYSFIAINRDGTVFSEVRPDSPIETASSIKSPMANIALRLAHNKGIDSSDYSMEVTDWHIPHNATTFMGDSLGESFSLNEIVRRTIIDSDATATNMLIDFIGGKEKVNEGLGKIGLDATQLLEDKLDIQELQTPNPNPVFGVSTVRQLAEYYRGLMRNPDDQPWSRDFISLHGLLKNVRLFSTKTELLQPSTSFLHKTGSIFSTEIPQAVLVDAGQLTAAKFPEGVYVAAALATYRKEGLRRINTEFSQRNYEQLNITPTDVIRDNPSSEVKEVEVAA